MQEGSNTEVAPTPSEPSPFSIGEVYPVAVEKQVASLTPEAILKRRLFAAHYVKSVNATSSARFAGFSSPHVHGSKLLKEPVVQHLLLKLLDNLEQESIVTRNEILLGLKREANDFELGTPSSRISALTQLAKVYAMLIDKTEPGEQRHQGGVMMVPALLSPDAWEEQSAMQQAALKAEVRK